MSTIDIEGLLQPISAEQHCGVDLSELTEYYVLDDLAAVREETQFSAATEPEWGKVRELATELLSRGKELWVVVHLVHSLAETEGFAGLGDGLLLLQRMLTTHWSELYPLLDSDDDNPAMQRMNILGALAAADGTFLASVKRIPLCASRQLGRFCWRDFQMAKRELPVLEGTEVPAPAVLEAAIRDTDPDATAALLCQLTEAIEALDAIDTFLTEQVGSANAADLSRLAEMLGKISMKVESISVGEESPGESGGSAMVSFTDAQGPVTGPDAPKQPQPTSVAIRSGRDVTLILDRICEWYATHEPSSPVPLLLQRAKRLVGKNFREIVHDVAGSAESQIDELFGSYSEGDDAGNGE